MDKRQTDVLNVDNYVENLEQHPSIQLAASRLKEDQVVAFPTETVYGLGGNALSDKAIEKIFRAKGRPTDNPLIVHIADQKDLDNYVKVIPNTVEKLMDAFWPGPLTIVLEHNGKIAPKVTANLSTVAIRMPDHPIALALIKAANLPLAAPSANTSGRPSPTKAEHVIEDLNGRIYTIINGGSTGVGVESTVVDCTGEKPMILRPGGITKEQIQSVVGEVLMDPALHKITEAPKSPGMKYTHYAPAAPLVLVDGDEEFFRKTIEKAQSEGMKVGLLITEEMERNFSVEKQVVIGTRSDLNSVAKNLYDALRAFEKHEVDVIYAEVFAETEIGTAIMNRLNKASGGSMILQHK
ncbi:L-threonylcarbamoyladenylate synthase [Evansella sp. AB-rgal1]|uniref:L-threonylcarbamoyladenylate synthase n=1 Tax=Evansella sp. AB-rgal1 TaxID=3242696 RepID=UPI00359D1B7C